MWGKDVGSTCSTPVSILYSGSSQNILNIRILSEYFCNNAIFGSTEKTIRIFQEYPEYIKKYSPYHNLKKDMNYPEVFFYTTTRDDRVHPGHARKMFSKMNDMGYKNYYYENTEGGHGAGSTNDQRARSTAMTFSYLLMKLK